MRLNLPALALALLVPLTAFAQDPAPAPEVPADPDAPPPPPPPPPPVDQLPPPPPMDMPPPTASAPLDTATGPAPATAPNLKWEGLVDSYYLYKFTGDTSMEDPALRAFDTLGNTFALGYAKLALQLDADPVGLRVDFGYGQVGAIMNTGSESGSDPMGNAALLYGSAFIVQQAYATARWGIVTLDAGRFNTTAGAEVTESNKNWLYSRSLLFYGIPALHTGLRLTLKPTDVLSIQASVTNGGVTNNDPDNNAFKTIGLSLGITPPDTGTTIALTSYIGKEGPQGMQGDMTFIIDLVASQAIGDSFGLNLNIDYFKLGEELWWTGAALMGRLALSEMAYLALRGEFVMGKNGGYGGAFPGGDLNLFEGTLMLGLPMGSNYEIRLEVRGDFASEDIFSKGAEAKANQMTGLAAFLAYF